MILFFILVVILLSAWRTLNWLWIRPKRVERFLRNQGFAGNPYRIFNGDNEERSILLKQAQSKPINLTDDIVSRVDPLQDHLRKKYGSKFFSWDGRIANVTIMDPQKAKEVMNRYDEFPKADSNPLIKLLISGIFFDEGKQWSRHRKLINPAFNVDKLKNMLSAFYQSSSSMIDKWEEMVPLEGPFELDVRPDIVKMTCDAISRTAFGSSYEEGHKIFKLIDEQSRLTYEAIYKGYTPGWRFVPTKSHRKMKEVDLEIKSRLKGIITKRERAVGAGEISNDDLLGILLESHFQGIKETNSKNLVLSLDDVIQDCKLFYFAGQETTSALLTWTLIQLARFPDWQERAREEIFRVLGDQEKLEYESLNHLKTVNMILHEVLRLYPPVPMVGRKTERETKVGDLILPKGVQILIPIIHLQHDHDIWGEDADEFKPERFSEGISKAGKDQNAFLAFGWGPRICVGLNFSIMEAKIVLSMILRRFSIELSPTYAHAPNFSLILIPQFGAQLILRKL